MVCYSAKSSLAFIVSKFDQSKLPGFTEQTKQKTKP